MQSMFSLEGTQAADSTPAQVDATYPAHAILPAPITAVRNLSLLYDMIADSVAKYASDA